MGTCRVNGVVLLSGTILLAVAATAADTPGGGGGPIDVQADRVEYDRSTGWAEAIGHVVIRRGQIVVRPGVNSNVGILVPVAGQNELVIDHEIT